MRFPEEQKLQLNENDGDASKINVRTFEKPVVNRNGDCGRNYPGAKKSENTNF
jgi:hypothetical protein